MQKDKMRIIQELIKNAPFGIFEMLKIKKNIEKNNLERMYSKRKI